MSETDRHFRNWCDNIWGFGYGTGEPYTTAALVQFFGLLKPTDASGPPRSYDYRELEAAMTPTVAWLVLNALCKHPSAIDYGTSPRHGWLSTAGERVRDYIATKTVDELVELVASRNADLGDVCYPDGCNCGPKGYEEGRICPNPFWGR